ncbi:alginate export family protein [Aurantiacibacter arachoides]|nr:alginate export family protein [Aurantiacibacter arachoides]
MTVLALFIATSPACAQEADTDAPFNLQDAIGSPEGLTISGSARIRYEVLGNQFRPGLDENDDLVTMRFTLAAEYDAGPVRIGGELFDARAYGGDEGSSVNNGDVNALELVQAYVGADLGDVLGEGSTTSLTAGRFTMDLGSRRLVGRNNFRNATNAFTGVRLDVAGTDSRSVTAFYTFPQQRLPADKAGVLDNEVRWDHEGDDLVFWGLFGTTPVAGHTLEAYVYGLDEDDRGSVSTRDRQLTTPGFRFLRAPRAGHLDYQIEYAYQFGERSVTTAAGSPVQDVSAHFLHLDAGYRLDVPWQPRIAAVWDYATGDGTGGDFGRFDSLYGPRRSDYGPTGIYGPLGRNNLSAIGMDFEFKPSARLDGFVKYRAAFLDSATDSFANTGVRDASGLSGTFGGNQLEGRLRYWFVPDFLRLDTGASVLINGRFLSDAPNANGFGDPVYGYVDLTATF